MICLIMSLNIINFITRNNNVTDETWRFIASFNGLKNNRLSNFPEKLFVYQMLISNLKEFFITTADFSDSRSDSLSESNSFCILFRFVMNWSIIIILIKINWCIIKSNFPKIIFNKIQISTANELKPSYTNKPNLFNISKIDFAIIAKFFIM